MNLKKKHIKAGPRSLLASSRKEMESNEILNIEFKNQVYSKIRVLYFKTLKTVVSVNIQAKNMWNLTKKHTVLPTMSVIDQIMSDDCHNKVLKQFDRVH